MIILLAAKQSFNHPKSLCPTAKGSIFNSFQNRRVA